MRDLVSNYLKTLVIKSHGRSKTYDTLKILNKMKNRECGDIIIQVGTYDCTTKKSVQEIIETLGWRAPKTATSATQVSEVTWPRSRFNTSGPDPLGFDWEGLAANRCTAGGHNGRPLI